MLYAKHTDLRLSLIGLGTRGMGSPKCDTKQWARVIDFALDNGINLIDTAPLYQNGSSEELLGELLRGKRKKIILSTKVGTHGEEMSLSPQAIKETLHGSLKRLQTDYIDILHIHYPDPRADYGTVASLLQEFKQQGIIREYGLSNFNCRELERWPMDDPPVTMQEGYNLLQWKRYSELEPIMTGNNIIPMVYTPLAVGMLAQPPEVACSSPIGKMLYGALSEEGKEKLADFFAVARENNLLAADLAIAWSLNRGKNVSLVGTSKVTHLQQALNALQLLHSDLMALLEPIPQPVLPLAGKLVNVLKTTQTESLVELELKAAGITVSAWVNGSSQEGDIVHLDGLTGEVIVQ